MSSSLYKALGDIDGEVHQIKMAITQEEDEVGHLKETLAQLKLQNQALTRRISKYDLEVQIAESEAAKAKVTKSGLQNEVGELKISFQELMERKEHVSKQLDRLNNHRGEMRNRYQELHDQFKEKYFQIIPGIAEYESIISVYNNMRDTLEKKWAYSKELNVHLIELKSQRSQNWKDFITACIKVAETYVKAAKIDSFLNAGVEERNELRNRLFNRSLTLNQKIGQIRRVSSQDRGSSVLSPIAFGSKLKFLSARKPGFHVPTSVQHGNLGAFGKSTPSPLSGLMSTSRTIFKPKDVTHFTGRTMETIRNALKANDVTHSTGRTMKTIVKPNAITPSNEKIMETNVTHSTDRTTETVKNVVKPNDITPSTGKTMDTQNVAKPNDVTLSFGNTMETIQNVAKPMDIAPVARPIEPMIVDDNTFGGNSMGLNFFGERSGGNSDLGGAESVFSFFNRSGGSLF